MPHASLSWSSAPSDEQLCALRAPPAGEPLAAPDAQALALAVALRGAGWVAPNPLVGAVLVDARGGFLAMGAHERYGEAHAEVMALRAAHAAGLGDRLHGATLYVTLEPCAHQGRTPACAPQVAAAGIARVVYGALDPNPRVNGRGEAILRAAGVACAADPAWAPACEDLAEVFLHGVRAGRPFVGLKAAASLDGIVARRGAQRAWITGPRARAYGHFLRQRYDAVAIGRGTLVADDPTLDPRDARLPADGTPARRTPWRVVVDPRLAGWRERPTGDWRMLAAAPERVAWVASAEAWEQHPEVKAALERRGARAVAVKSVAAGLLPPAGILDALAPLGITSVLLEGGSGLHSTFLSARLVDRVHLFQAPRILGRADGDVVLPGPLALRGARLAPLDGDWLVEAAPAYDQTTNDDDAAAAAARRP